MTWPRPWQVEQVRAMLKKPCWWRDLAVCRFAGAAGDWGFPGAVPAPRQASQVSCRRTVTVFFRAEDGLFEFQF